jgi:two-component system cell cycle sensor histidine kinase/response regulator CckA
MKIEKRAPLAIALVYGFLGALWILVSGRVMLKGIFFVLSTSALLYWLVRRHVKKLLGAQKELERENRECKLVQESLKESEEQFHNMFDKNRAVMYLVDPVTLCIFDANEAARKFYGYSEAQFRDLKVKDVCMLDEEDLKARMEQEVREGGFHNVLKHKLSDGSVRDVEVYASMIRLTKREFYFAIVHDVTARIQSEKSLLESETRYRSLVETTNDWIWELDENGVFTYSSPRIRDVLGYEPHEIIGKTPFDLMPAPEAENARKFFHTFRDVTEPLAGIEHRNVHKDGRIVILESSWVPVFDVKGRFTGCRGIARDITLHKQLEEQLRHAQKMNAIGELAGGIAHDFNNILTTIIGYIYILQTRLTDESLKKFVEHLNYSAQRAASLVSKLLAFGRKQIISLQPMKINDVIIKSKSLLSRLIQENIEIRTVFSEDDITVMGDEGQIEQVVMNLVTNARDAMPVGGVLTIRTERFFLDKKFVDARGYGNPGPYALISFTDTGVGMDEKTRERIFEPFFTTKEVGKGTGLGLAIVYGIVKQHNGFIEVFSEPGKGTTFKLYLPTAEESPSDRKSRAPDVPAKGAGTILVGEDDPDTRLFLKTVLEDSGYTVIEAVDGRDAVEKFRQERHSIRLLMLDIIMPRQNGRDAYEDIRKICPEVKTIFLSGYTGEFLDSREPLGEGLHFMEKPVAPWQLLEKVKEMLD